jgi:hypothetical protein
LFCFYNPFEYALIFYIILCTVPSGTGTKDGYFQMYNNFTSGIEYYYNVHANTCDLYGLNYWSDWCYGSANVQTYKGSVKVGNEIADIWAEAATPFTWTVTRGMCTPVSNARMDTGEGTFYFDMQAGPFDASVFQLPQACIDAEVAASRANAKLPASTRKGLNM